MDFTFSYLSNVLKDRKEMGEFARSKLRLGRECLPLLDFIMKRDNIRTITPEKFTEIRFFYITCKQLKSLSNIGNTSIEMNDTLTKIASEIIDSDIPTLKARFLREGDCYIKLIYALEQYQRQKELVPLYTSIVENTDDPIEWYRRNEYKLTFNIPENKLLNKMTETLTNLNYNFE